ncbi:patatin-like phospholipase family protein [Fulvivirga sp.]|uniref:patatin-like phospholipase family protein n=1 Tax=Fulvivirga sp. TaxID=1931237 RepID=UPI0032EBC1EC
MKNTNYRNLVFEGGGVKGIAYGGALDVLDSSGILKNIKRIAGTSAGAINATLLALGYSSTEVSDLIAKTNFKEFEDNSRFFPTNIARILRKYGWNKGDAFHHWIGEQINKKAQNTNFTFGQLKEAIDNGNESFRELYVVATNLSQQKSVVFSHETTPYMPIKDAVRMSMSIPLYFAAYKLSNDMMVDGGVSYNYPINIFDNEKYLANPANGDKVDYSNVEGYVFNYESLGFRLDSTEVIEYAKRDWASPPEKITNIKSYSAGLINYLMEMANKVHLHSNDWNRTIFIDTLDVQTTDFDLPENKIIDLIASGKKGAEKYFEWRDRDEVWGKRPIV